MLCHVHTSFYNKYFVMPSFLFFLRYAGLSLLWPLPLRSTGSGRAGSAAMAHGPSRSAACGILPDWGTNPCPLHQQADSQPLRHQGSPTFFFLKFHIYVIAYGICLSLCDLLHSVGQTLDPSTSLQIIQFHFFLWLSNIPLYICATSSLSIHLLMET